MLKLSEYRYLITGRFAQALALFFILLSAVTLPYSAHDARTGSLAAMPVVFLAISLYVKFFQKDSRYIFFATVLFFSSLYPLYQLLSWYYWPDNNTWLFFSSIIVVKCFIVFLVAQVIGLISVFTVSRIAIKYFDYIVPLAMFFLLSGVFVFIKEGMPPAVLLSTIYWLSLALYVCLLLICMFCVNEVIFCTAISAMLMIAYALCYQFVDQYFLPHFYANILLYLGIVFALLALHRLKKGFVLLPIRWTATSIHAYVCLISFVIGLMFFSIAYRAKFFLFQKMEWRQLVSCVVFLLTFSVILSRLLSFFVSQSIRCTAAGYQGDALGIRRQLRHRYFHFYELDELNRLYANALSELNDINREKSAFLVNMSHDFRTPASGIFSMSQLIYSKLVDEKLIHLQGLVVDSAKQLMRILDEVMLYSKMDLSPVSGDLSTINLIAVIDDVAQLMTPKASEKKLSLNVVHETGYLNLLTDKMMLHRILINIVSNAVKFTDHGCIKITSGHRLHANGQMVYVKIEDSGVGIDPKCHRRIFEPFFKVSQDNRRHDGVGLGLSISRLMIKKLGGVIELNSALSLGACFTILLPAKLHKNGEYII